MNTTFFETTVFFVYIETVRNPLSVGGGGRRTEERKKFARRECVVVVIRPCVSLYLCVEVCNCVCV